MFQVFSKDLQNNKVLILNKILKLFFLSYI